MNRHFRFRSAERSHEGRVRAENEDACLVREEDGLWAVADGMGGHENGKWASQTVVAALKALPLNGQFVADSDAIAAGLHGANATIRSAAAAAGRTMGSTAVVLLVRDTRFACFWVGDSRVYLYRNGQLVQLTRDHTQVQTMIDRGLIGPEEAEGHPLANVVNRAVGVEEAVQVDAIADDVQPRDIFLLCSDGLSGFVSAHEIEDRLTALSPAPAAQNLLDLVLSRGAPDNVTLVLVACEERTAVLFEASA